MKYKICCFITLALLTFNGYAQQFISRGTIEFEVITNVKKSNGKWIERIENLPTHKTVYYSYNFANNKSIYKFDHYDESKAKAPEFLRRGDDENQWYFDFTTDQTYVQKSLYGTILNLKDSIAPIEWKLTNESRLIAGFNCRKAIGKIFDSVYVFAFYTDEITISGGPCSINGLPGMILGITIPRLYVSMIATKLSVNNLKENEIKPATSKKYYTSSELKDIIEKRIKEDFSNQEMDEDSKTWINQFFWNTML
jgi:GLPGLI family protein